MRLFHETSVTLFGPKKIRACVISDIHYSYQVKNDKLNALAKKIKERSPDYIFLPGDLVDYNDLIFNEKEERRLLNWLEKLGKIAPLLISQGNHDVYKKPNPEYKKEHGTQFEIFENKSFVEKMTSLENVYYLNDSSYEDKNIYVFGFSQQPKYYNFESKKYMSIFNPIDENADEMLRELDAVDQKLITNLPKNKLKIALIHSPVHLNDFRIQAELSEFDYFISGHMHNGIIPPFIDEFWRSDKGIVSPTRNMLPYFSRSSVKTIDDKIIISGAVTTWHECTGPLHNLNAFYPSYFMTLDFTTDKKYQNHPVIKRQYLNYD